MDEPAYLPLLRDLRAAIADGTYAPGAKLPTSRVLTETYGIGRNSVTRAYALLTRDGLVHRTYAGMFVGPPTG